MFHLEYFILCHYFIFYCCKSGSSPQAEPPFYEWSWLRGIEPPHTSNFVSATGRETWEKLTSFSIHRGAGNQAETLWKYSKCIQGTTSEPCLILIELYTCFLIHKCAQRDFCQFVNKSSLFIIRFSLFSPLVPFVIACLFFAFLLFLLDRSHYIAQASVLSQPPPPPPDPPAWQVLWCPARHHNGSPSFVLELSFESVWVRFWSCMD